METVCDEKTCTKCNEVKPTSEFTKDKANPTGFKPWCKSCTKEHLNRPEIKERNNARRRAKWAGREEEYKQEWSLLKKYKMTLKQYNEKLAAQGGVCMICKQPPGKRPLAVDHDSDCCPGQYTCGQCVRDLLCFRCNSGIGSLQHSVKILLNAARYLIKWRRKRR